ncbi:DUF6875 domain-containing protein [Nocardia sp. NPDC048505]|uniref:DUF6875 domain-containing protein n=1 Tax=Nocardia sp. NPDC048505 TaxID=3155756 RepID=UPI00340FFFFA
MRATTSDAGREPATVRFSEPSDQVAETISHWLRSVIAQPHVQLGREGPICPFVQPALRARELSVLVHRWQGPDQVTQMRSVVRAIVQRFRDTDANASNRKLHALVVVIEGLQSRHFRLIDEGHRAAKDLVIQQGYMLGQFHPECDEPAVRNPLFPVNRAPYPLFAVRHMAVHDILFLHDDRGWFEQYRRRFGHRYTADSRLDRHFRDLFEMAERKYIRLKGEFA